MSYEHFRNQIADSLLQSRSVEDVREILAAIDQVASGYDIAPKCTDLIVPDGPVPQIVKLFIASSAAAERSPRTVKDYLRILARFFEAVRLPFTQITTNDIRAYLYQYKQEHNVRESTLDHYRIVINNFFAWCVNDEYLVRNPAAKIQPYRIPEEDHPRLNRLELETLRSACHSLREKALVDFLYSTACRVSELCSMEIGDVNLQERTVRIRLGKGRKSRVSYLNAECIVSLTAYLKSRRDDCPSLFVSLRNPAHSLTPRAIQQELHKISARTSIQANVTPHAMRRTAATLSLSAGMPVEQVQRFLGHSKISTTMIYAKVDDADVKASHAKFSA